MTFRLSTLMTLALGLTITSMAAPANAETCHAAGDPKCSITSPVIALRKRPVCARDVSWSWNARECAFRKNKTNRRQNQR